MSMYLKFLEMKFYDLLDNGGDEKLMSLVEEDKVQFYNIKVFNDAFIPSLERELTLLRGLEKQ